jgi:hypothetical protein
MYSGEKNQMHKLGFTATVVRRPAAVAAAMLAGLSLAALVAAVFLASSLAAPTEGYAAGWSYQTIAIGGTAPGAFDGLYVPAINAKGEVAFAGSYLCKFPYSCNGVWRWSPGDSSPTLLDSSLTDGQYPYSYFNSATINDDGQVGFDYLTYEDDGDIVLDRIMVATGSVLTQIAPTRVLYAGGIDVYYLSPTLLRDGSAVFRANGTYLLQRTVAGSVQTINRGYPACSVPVSSPKGLVAYPEAQQCTAIDETNALTGKTQFRVQTYNYGNLVQNTVINDLGEIAFATDDVPGYGNDFVDGLFINIAGHTTLLATINNGPCETSCHRWTITALSLSTTKALWLRP